MTSIDISTKGIAATRVEEWERAFELEADEYRATEVRTMETVIWITRDMTGGSIDMQVAVDVEIDGYGVRPDSVGKSIFGNKLEYQLTKAEMDRAADQAWEEAHDDQ